MGEGFRILWRGVIGKNTQKTYNIFDRDTFRNKNLLEKCYKNVKMSLL